MPKLINIQTDFFDEHAPSHHQSTSDLPTHDRAAIAIDNTLHSVYLRRLTNTFTLLSNLYTMPHTNTIAHSHHSHHKHGNKILDGNRIQWTHPNSNRSQSRTKSIKDPAERSKIIHAIKARMEHNPTPNRSNSNMEMRIRRLEKLMHNIKRDKDMPTVNMTPLPNMNMKSGEKVKSREKVFMDEIYKLRTEVTQLKNMNRSLLASSRSSPNQAEHNHSRIRTSQASRSNNSQIMHSFDHNIDVTAKQEHHLVEHSENSPYLNVPYLNIRGSQKEGHKHNTDRFHMRTLKQNSTPTDRHAHIHEESLQDGVDSILDSLTLIKQIRQSKEGNNGKERSASIQKGGSTQKQKGGSTSIQKQQGKGSSSKEMSTYKNTIPTSNNLHSLIAAETKANTINTTHNHSIDTTLHANTDTTINNPTDNKRILTHNLSYKHPVSNTVVPRHYIVSHPLPTGQGNHSGYLGSQIPIPIPNNTISTTYTLPTTSIPNTNNRHYNITFQYRQY